MPIVVPDYGSRNYFSAGIMNAWTNALVQLWARSTAPNVPFSTNTGFSYTEDESVYWTGHILYTGRTDTMRIHFETSGSGNSNNFVYMGGVQVYAANIAAGVEVNTTVSISGNGFVPGTVYQVTFAGDRSSGAPSGDLYWIGLEYSPSYTAPPTFVNTNVLTAANLTALRDGIVEIIENGDLPNSPFGFTGDDERLEEDGEETVWRGFITHTGNNLKYSLTMSAENNNGKARLFINDPGKTSAFQEWPSGTSVEFATLDISSAGLTVGQRYEFIIDMKQTGTTQPRYLSCNIQYVAEEGSGSPTTPPDWAVGDTDIGATNMNWYSDTIKAIHPGAPSPTLALIYNQPAIQISEKFRFTLRRMRDILRYIWRDDTTGTPEIDYEIGKVGMPSKAGNQSYQLTSIADMGLGQYYSVDDVQYVTEYDY